MKIAPCFMPDRDGKPCGGKVSMEGGTGPYWWTVCHVCNAQGPVCDSPDQAITAHALLAKRMQENTVEEIEAAMEKCATKIHIQMPQNLLRITDVADILTQAKAGLLPKIEKE